MKQYLIKMRLEEEKSVNEYRQERERKGKSCGKEIKEDWNPKLWKRNTSISSAETKTSAEERRKRLKFCFFLKKKLN